MSSRLVSVAVPVPALGLLTYHVPDAFAVPPVGARVVVPLGSRRLTGLVLGPALPLDPSIDVRDIIEVLDHESFVPADVVELTSWVSDYYLAGRGAALAAALPPHGLTSRVDAFKTVRMVTITAQGLDVVDRLIAPRCVDAADADLPRLGGRQREALQAAGGPSHRHAGAGPDGAGHSLVGAAAPEDDGAGHDRRTRASIEIPSWTAVTPRAKARTTNRRGR